MSHPAAVDDEKRRVLFTAVRLNRADIIQAVAVGSSNGGAEKEFTVDSDLLRCLDDTGTFTAMHLAVERNSIDAMRMLLKIGFDIKLKANNRTAVEFAFESASFADPQQVFIAECVQCIASGDIIRLGEFLDAGLPAEAGIPQGDNLVSILSWARDMGNPDIISLLESKQHTDISNNEIIHAPNPIAIEISECRAFIASLADEKQSLHGLLVSRGTERIVSLLRDAQRRVIDAHTVFELQEKELLHCSETVARILQNNNELQAKINSARSARNISLIEFKVGDLVVYFQDNDRQSNFDAEIIQVHRDFPQSVYYTVRTLQSQEEIVTNPKSLRPKIKSFDTALFSNTKPAKRRLPRSESKRRLEEQSELLEQLLTVAAEIEEEVIHMRLLAQGKAKEVVRRISHLQKEAEEMNNAVRLQNTEIASYRHRIFTLEEHGEKLLSLLNAEYEEKMAIEIDEHRNETESVPIQPNSRSFKTGSNFVSAYDDPSMELLLRKRAEEDESGESLWFNLLDMLFGWKNAMSSEQEKGPILIA